MLNILSTMLSFLFKFFSTCINKFTFFIQLTNVIKIFFKVIYVHLQKYVQNIYIRKDQHQVDEKMVGQRLDRHFVLMTFL